MVNNGEQSRHSGQVTPTFKEIIFAPQWSLMTVKKQMSLSLFSEIKITNT